MLKLIIESSEKKTVELNNELIKLSNFLCYRQRKLMALNLKRKFKFSTGNWNLNYRDKILGLKKYRIYKVFKRIPEKKSTYI